MNIKSIVSTSFSCLFYLAFSNGINAQEFFKDSLVAKIEEQSGKEKLASLQFFCDYFADKDPKLVLGYVEPAIELALAFENQTTLTKLYLNKGTSKAVLGEMNESLLSLNLAMKNAKALKDTFLITKNTLAFGNYYSRQGDFKKAETYYVKTKRLSAIVGDVEMGFTADFNIATTYISRGLHKKAILVYNELYGRCPHEKIDCNGVLFNKAICTYMLGEPSEALAMLFEAKTIDEAIDFELRVQSINHHIAYILESVGLFEESLKYYNEVLHYFNKQGELRQKASVNETIGGLLEKLHRSEEAKEYFLRSLKIQKDNGLKTYGTVLVALGNMALAEKEFDKASTYYDEAEPLLKEIKLKRGFVILLLGRANLSIAQGEYSEAEGYIQKALFICKKLELVKLQVDSYEKLALVLEKQERFEEALAARDTQQQLNIGVADKSAALAINQKLVHRKLSENEKKISILKDLALQEQGSNKVLLFLISTAFLMVIGSILYFNRRKLWKSKFGNKVATLDAEEASQLIQSLEEVMHYERPYLREDLTLIELAELLPSTQKKLSVLLNTYLDTNFYDYVNKYRVTAFKSLVKNVDYSKYSTLGMASECGFKSKSSFYRIFKKETGQSPGEYKKQVLNKTVP